MENVECYRITTGGRFCTPGGWELCYNFATMEPRERLIIPLDVATTQDAQALVERLVPQVGFFKVGMELFHSEGPAVLEMVHKLAGPTFFDGKFFDIPNTVAGAAAAVTRLGVRMFNVHAMGGKAMMAAAREAAECTAAAVGVPRPVVLGVTVVTSLDERALLEEVGVGRPMTEQVLHLARMAHEAGLDGVVASAMEAPAIKAACGADFVVVCPGIRLAGGATHDQARVVTPRLAREAGADYLVVGRPITAAKDPVEAAKQVVAEMTAAEDGSAGKANPGKS
jgi:orotidine-5'-phosphate decarboxylase